MDLSRILSKACITLENIKIISIHTVKSSTSATCRSLQDEYVNIPLSVLQSKAGEWKLKLESASLFMMTI